MTPKTLRRLLPVVIVLSAALAGPVAAQAAATPMGARLLASTVARSAPDRTARAVASVSDRTPFTASATTLPVVDQATDPQGATWLRVRLPDRPNGATGWIAAARTQLVALHWGIVVHLRARRALVFRDGVLARSYRVVVGAPGTPTPTGEFFVVEKLKLQESWAPGRWALATSAHSNVLRHFDGGDGQVALHARGFLVARVGTAASHGCVRFDDADIAWVARHVGDGTPVTITS